MKTRLMSLFCGIGLLAAGCSKSHAPDSSTLQGTWTGSEGGAKTAGTPTLAILGTNLDFQGADPQEWYKATFTLHEDTKPKRLEVVITDCPAPQFVGKTAHAIYKIENGELTVTGNPPGNPNVPADFGTPGSRQIVFKKPLKF